MTDRAIPRAISIVVPIHDEYTSRTLPFRSLKTLLLLLCLWWLLPAALAFSGASHVIQDANGGLIYWGGKYVNVKPSQQGDAIGRRSQVDQMVVIMKDDIVTVKITGPYLRNYARNVGGTRVIPPGDLYIASQGWKVRGVPPYTEDVFEASEGWDYVISLAGKALHKLNFADIVWTRPRPRIRKFRANQAWRGGYGQRVDDAVVEQTDAYLSFTFSVRNMRLGPEIGLHWTMMCGNDIIEGSAPLPAIALDPATVDPTEIHVSGPANGVDTLADGVLLTPFSSAASYPGPIFSPPSVGSGVGAGGPPPGAAGLPMVLVAPLFFGGDDDDDFGPPTGPPIGPPDGPPGNPTPVSEPVSLVGLVLGMLLACLTELTRRRIARRETSSSRSN